MSSTSTYTNLLCGKHVLIVGGSSGIGYAVAEASVEHGMHVSIASSNPKRVGEALRSLGESYPAALLEKRLYGYPCGLNDPKSLDENLKTLFNQVHSPLDHVIFTAGDALAIGDVREATFESIQAAGTVRFFAPLLLAKHAAAKLNPEGSIVLTTGANADKPSPGWAVLNGFFTGLCGMVRGLALDLAPLRVNAVSPGGVQSPMWHGMMNEQAVADLYKIIAAGSTTGRVATPADIAQSYIYLMKDRNATGSIVRTDSGALIK